jgi:hypothetical protein
VTRSRFTHIAAVLITVVLLASCRVDSVVTLKVKPNGSGTVSVVVTTNADIVSKAPGLKTDVRVDDLKEAGWKVTGPVDTDDGGVSITLTRAFNGPLEATAILNQINGTRGPLKQLVVTRTGKDTNSTWTLAGKLEVNGGLDAFADDAALELLGGGPYIGEFNATGLDLGKVVGVTFNAELPGTVDATTGLQKDGAITWRIPMDGTATDVATTTTNVDVASSISRVGRVFLLGLLILWAFGTVVLLMLVLNARKRRSRTPRI